jgi:hypothetical protein
MVVGRGEVHRLGIVPRVRLGTLEEGGIAPAVHALVEQGVARRPDLAEAMEGEVELRWAEGWPSVRIWFGRRAIVVADGRPERPDLVVSATLPDLVAVTAAPLVGGVPKPTDQRGRAALRALARGQVRLVGSRTFGRRLLTLLGTHGSG